MHIAECLFLAVTARVRLNVVGKYGVAQGSFISVAIIGAVALYPEYTVVFAHFFMRNSEMRSCLVFVSRITYNPLLL